jgi:predicted GIY-YIG superfamily endonuclease
MSAPVVYRLVALSGRLLYVGSTRRLKERLKEHRATKHWWPDVARVQITECETIAEAPGSRGH